MRMTTTSCTSQSLSPDLFPETTRFCLQTFQALQRGSTREPSQVFVLLETIYKAFDEIAKRQEFSR
jgi:hypothetical protein